MIEDESKAQRTCTCGRPLRREEQQCPHCKRVAAASWKAPIGNAGVVVVPLLTIVVGLLAKAGMKPKA